MTRIYKYMLQYDRVKISFKFLALPPVGEQWRAQSLTKVSDVVGTKFRFPPTEPRISCKYP